MPLPPSFTCPVCQKKKQRGLLGVHLVKHSKAELLPFITNLESSHEPGWHPELDCSDHTYIVCFKNDKGFEKDKPLHKSHKCTHNYSDWAKTKSDQTAKTKKPRDDSLQSKTMQEVIDICKAKGIGGYSGLRKNEIIKLIEDNNKPHAVGCNCHIEITKLKEELESYKKWKHTLLTCMPGSKYEPEPAFVVTLPQENVIEEEEVAPTPEPIQTQAKPQVTFHTSVKEKKPMASKPMASKPMPSKKELEKGMWCTKCESCKFTAQYTKDLKPCGSCHKLCHFNDDMGNCYLWDCVGCAKAVCKECNKAAGGNRLNPYCSKACAKSADC